MVEEHVNDVLELVLVVWREESIPDHVEDLPQLSISVVVIVGVVAGCLQGFDIINSHSKDEDIIHSHFLGHLDISTVECPDGESSVEHELHVSSSTGLSAGCGDLLGEVSSGHDLLSKGHAVV